MSEIKDKKFYVLRVVSGKELKVKEQVEAEMKITDLGLSVFRVIIPVEKVVSQRNGKKIVKERPSMPGYILVEAVLNGDVVFRLRQMQNVVGFLGSRDGVPDPMRPADVDAILRKMDDMAEGEGEYEFEVLVGDLVRVIDGAFVGSEAVVEDVNQAKKQLKVMVKMFGRKMPLELSFAQVSKV